MISDFRFTCVPCSRVHANLVSCVSQASGHFLYLLFCPPVVLAATKLKAISVVFVTFYWGSIEKKQSFDLHWAAVVGILHIPYTIPLHTV